MSFGRFFRIIILSPVVTVLTLFALALLYAGFRLVTYEQSDSREHLEYKKNYLQEITRNPRTKASPPNIIFILYDDMGYGDIGLASTDLIDTPNFDRLAREGLSFTSFYSPAAVCTPSRAGFLTGRTPLRAGMPYVVFPTGSAIDRANRVTSPNGNLRLPAEEITLADVVRAAGYRTGMVGKWHLGDRHPSLPNDFGFDYFFGSLYSNDMQPFELYRNTEVAVPEPVDQRYLSEIYSREVVEFILKDSDKPFFLYHAHNFPHDPLHSRDERLGLSDGGLFGDVVEELDDGIGHIISALEKSGKLDNTILLISSDNGPWYLGSSGPQRGRKGSTFEGGVHVPLIVSWPAVIREGKTVAAMASGLDLLPTVLEILHIPPPADREIDGKSILPVVNGTQSHSPHNYLYYFDGKTHFATRDARFKYRAGRPVAYGVDEMGFKLAVPQKEWLFDLQRDPLESYDVSARHPEVFSQLRNASNVRANELERNTRGWRTASPES